MCKKEIKRSIVEMDSSEKESFYYSKRSPTLEDIQSEDESEGKAERCKFKDGGSSSSSTVEEGEKKPSVRQYVRSKMPRLRWTPDLHTRFVRAVERLGGQDRATPKSVLQLMDIRGLKIAHIKSHLQMYRSKKIIDESSPGMMMMADHRLFMEGIDQNGVFKLTQFPLLPTFNQGQTSDLRYGNHVSWNGHGKWKLSPTKPGFYNPNIGRIFTNHFHRSANPDQFCSKMNSLKEKFNQDPKDQRHGSVPVQESRSNQSIQNLTELNSLKLLQQRFINNDQRIWSDTAKSPSISQTGFKRKASDCELDLNLSLGLESRTEEEQQGTVLDEEHFRLSLHTCRMKKAKDVWLGQNARGMSTLDLTL